ncbi:sporulation integral membrane protein YlbJ [Ammoniphilus oxalaticus]|uniref:Sporulation integral membrane protein YlbJ n=1 Tax=Ammoniphilus oxalaticus TaxID=66863 RepID=A0A419SJM2_9BACL|nr:sporulation integral membrane protein YlbJ [Ammoniphilus oxalaticus]RKD24160.1 sporulation integral membrane protein YlbJ [Ammoniphilus oxalaticus]
MRYKPYIQTLLFAALSVLLVFCMIRFPQDSFHAALRGLKIWWDVVFPALLPFMILSEIMMGFGVVHFIGVLLEPLMRPLFKVPGTGGFVMAMGFSSGYPVGPKLATQLRQQKLVTRAEGERLVCFTSTTDPLFIFGAVAVGFFHDATLGITIAIANYVGALLVGIMLRFHDRRGQITSYTTDQNQPLLLRALQAMHRARLKERRPFGQLMGDAVMSSFQTLFVIGGFIIIFSVIIEFISMGAISIVLASILTTVLSLFQLPEDLSQVFVIGFFEVTQSMQYMSELNTPIGMEIKLAVASALVAWGGISVHAQVASIISSTDMRYKPYFIWKGIHAFIAGALAFLFWKPFQSLALFQFTLPAFAEQTPTGGLILTWNNFQHIGLFASLFLLGLALISYMIHLISKRRLNN